VNDEKKRNRGSSINSRTMLCEQIPEKGLASTQIVSGASIPAEEPSRCVKTHCKPLLEGYR